MNRVAVVIAALITLFSFSVFAQAPQPQKTPKATVESSVTAEPHWTGYVGMITGIVGAITGISGAIMGYIGYRRSNRLKALELRLELRKATSDFHAGVPQVRDLIERAHKSKRNLDAARGVRGSGHTDSWEAQMKTEKHIVEQLSAQFQKSEADFYTMSERELESGLVTVHQLQNHLQKIRDKYLESIRFDEQLSKEIREDNRKKFSPHS